MKQHPLDTWPLPIGKYKATFISQVPIEYLKNLSKDGFITRNYPQIKEYLEHIQKTELVEILQARLDGEMYKQKCAKITYATEAIAKSELTRIKAREQKHKKPYRAYECPDCGGWHLTSREDINWLNKQSQ